MNKTINIPNKKINRSPQFRHYVPGRNVTFSDIDHRVEKINATGGAGGGLQVVTQVLEPEELVDGDYWFQVSGEQ